MLSTECKIDVLAVKLAREAIFGDIVLKKCTARGWNNLPALPQVEQYKYSIKLTYQTSFSAFLSFS